MEPLLIFFRRFDIKTGIEKLSRGYGYGDEYNMCTFASVLEPWEEGYFGDGVEFSQKVSGVESSIVLSYKDFIDYAESIASGYLEVNPSDSKFIHQHLNIIRERYNL